MRMEAPSVLPRTAYYQGVYLHAYGGTKKHPKWKFPIPGLSPCVWRHLKHRSGSDTGLGSISMRMEAPAWTLSNSKNMRVYLHAYGGTYFLSNLINSLLGLSPCVWRHQPQPNRSASRYGSISMRMEAPMAYLIRKLVYGVYLHAYGGTHNLDTSLFLLLGLSPCVWRHLFQNLRSILK